MAIETAANLRGLVRSGLVIALGMLSFSGAGNAQKNLVSTGSVIPFPLNLPVACQIYKTINAPNGDTVFLDVCGGGGYGSLYQLPKGSTTMKVICRQDRHLGHVLERGHGDGCPGNALYYRPLQRQPAHLSRAL